MSPYASWSSMKWPSVRSVPIRMTSALWTATTGAPGEAVMLAPATVGPGALVQAAAASAGGGAGAPVAEECAALAESAPTGSSELLQTAVAVWDPLPSSGKRPLTIAVRLLMSDGGVAAISWLRNITDST